MASPVPGAVLPPEILGIIISFVFDTGTLNSLSRACRAFAVSAEPYLYATLRFEPGPQAIQLARTLIRSRRKSRLVRSIVTSLNDREFPLLPATAKLIVRAIVGCPNLKNLSVSWGLKFNWATQLMVPNKFQLQQFNTILQWDPSVGDFLETQPSLKELGIVQPARLAVQSQARLSDCALPFLSTFMGRLSQALAVVPGRPVTSLVLHGSITLRSLESALPILAQASAQIESLSLQAEELSSSLLTILSAYIPTLTRLELRIVRSAMVAYSNLTSKSVCQALSLMSCLSHFRLRLRCPQLFLDPFFHVQRDVVLDWGCYCPSLKKVVFDSSSEVKAPEWTYDEEAMDWMCSLDE